MKCRILGLFLAVSIPPFGHIRAENLDIQISNETVPEGAIAHVKVFLNVPRPIESGYIQIAFDAGASDAPPPTPISATVFSVAGDVSAFVGDPLSASSPVLRIFFRSPSAGVGRAPGLPIAQFEVQANAPFSVSLDPRVSYFLGPGGKYSVVASEGRVALGGELSIQDIAQSVDASVGSNRTMLVIAGTGFSTITSVDIEGVAIASFVVRSPQEIAVTLDGLVEITGKHIQIRNTNGEHVDAWGHFGTSTYTTPVASSVSGSCVLNGPALHDPVILVLQNPNSTPASVTLTNALDSATGKPGTVRIVTPAGGTNTVNIVDPANTMFVASTSTPLRATCFYATHGDFSLLTWPSINLDQRSAFVGWVANAAELKQASISPGEIITLFGTGIGPEAPAYVTFDNSGRVPGELGGVVLLIGGAVAPLLYVSSTQVNAIVPYETANESSAEIEISVNGASVAEWYLPVASSAPGIFMLNSSRQAAALNQDNSINGPGNPASRGSVIQIFATGEGSTLPPGATGEVTGADIKKPLLPVSVSIGEVEATVTYAGSAPHAVAGLSQINAVVPAKVSPGNAIPVVLTVGTSKSMGAVISVK